MQNMGAAMKRKTRADYWKENVGIYERCDEGTIHNFDELSTWGLLSPEPSRNWCGGLYTLGQSKEKFGVETHHRQVQARDSYLRVLFSPSIIRFSTLL